jgi:hypothetical protein
MISFGIGRKYFEKVYLPTGNSSAGAHDNFPGPGTYD